ncbi:MAG: DUF2157 domain-containing protein [Spirochaetes bacterium]|nr:DUF2157 domain-containing protein [Spirochaetota bacterium]
MPMEKGPTGKAVKLKRSFVNRLFAELPSLIASNVISAAVADDIRRYYETRASGERRNTVFVVFGIVGSVLVGLGIILLIAYNWSAMTKAVKTVFAFALLAAGIGVSGFAYFTRRDSAAWRESAGTLLFLIIGAVLALIGQIYHLPSDTGAFMLTWVLLAVPVVYMLDASAPAVLYIAGITGWAGIAQSEGGHALLFWPLAAVIAWHFIRHFRENPFSVRSAFIAWSYALAACVSIGVSLEKVIPGLWIIIYSSYFAVLFLIGGIWLSEAPTIWQRPFYIIGSVGVSLLSLVFTFKECWHNVGIGFYRSGGKFHPVAAITDYILVAGLTLLAVYLFIVSIRKRKDIAVILFGLFPVIAAGCYLLAMYRLPFHPAWVFNLYACAIGVAAIISGIRGMRQGIVNGGMLIIAVLIFMRFIDMDLSILARAIVFLVIGCAFLAANAILAKVFKRSAPQ